MDYRPFALFIVAIALVYGAYNTGRSLFGPNQGGDFSQKYIAARSLLEGNPALMYDRGRLYREQGHKYGIKESITNAYPPFVASFMIPLSVLPYDAARYVFYFVSFVSVIGGVILLFADRPTSQRLLMSFVGRIQSIFEFQAPSVESLAMQGDHDRRYYRGYTQ
jgi:hypothetical protein